MEWIIAVLAGSIIGSFLGIGLAMLIIKFFEWVFG